MSRLLDALRKTNQETSVPAPKIPTKKGTGKMREAFEKITGKEKKRKILSSFFPNINEEDMGKYDFSNFESWGYISTTDKDGKTTSIYASGDSVESIKNGEKWLETKKCWVTGLMRKSEYNKDGKLTKVTTTCKDGAIAETEYDIGGREIKETWVLPNGRVRETGTQLPGYKIETYPDGRVKTIRQPSGREVHYNEKGQLIKTKDGKIEREFNPETEDLIKVKEGEMESEFDKNGRLIKVKGRNGAEIEFGSFDKVKIKYDASAPTSALAPTTTPRTPDTTPVPKTAEEIAVDLTRESYFKIVKNSRGSIQAAEAWDFYRGAKKRAAEIYLNNGPEGKIKAQEFLLREVELVRHFDLENGLAGSGERIVAGISNGIKWWDNIGNDTNDKEFVRKLKKAGKMLTSVALIGGASVGMVAGAAALGIGSATAIGGSAVSYLTRRTLISAAMGSALSKLPPGLQKFASPLLLGVSSLTSSVGGAIAISGAAGYAASKLAGFATKKWLSEEAIIKKRKTIEETELKLNDLENSITKLESEYEKFTKEAERKRMYRGVVAGATALSVGVLSLELIGHKVDNLNTENEIKIEKEASDAEARFARTQHGGKDIELKSDLPPTTPGETIPGQPTEAGSESVPPNETVPPPVNTTTFDSDSDAIVHKGEGIEHALRRQIENNPELAKALGYKGDTSDTKALHEFSGGAAHRVALFKGYVDGETGEEIRVRPADEIAYKLSLSGNENDPFKVEEIKLHGGFVEGHGNETNFEGDKKEDYEYRHKDAPKPPMEPKIPGSADPSNLTPDKFSFADPEEARMAEERAMLETMPPTGAEISSTENPETTEGGISQDQIDALRKQGYNGDPGDIEAIAKYSQDRAAEIKADLEKKYDTGKESELMTDEVKKLNATLKAYREGQGEELSESRAPRPMVIDKVVGNPFDLDQDELRQADQIYQDNVVKLFGDESRWETISHEKASDILKNGQYITNDTGVMGPTYNYLQELRKIIPNMEPQGNLLIGRESVEHFVARAVQRAVEQGGSMLEKVQNIQKVAGR